MQLPICYEDDDLIAVNKPAGMLVHRSKVDRTATVFALQTVRNMVGAHVFPLHRLDKPTSGVLLFAKSADVARAMQTLFTEHAVQKYYLAVVRGFPPEQSIITRPLHVLHDKTTDEKAKTKPAQAAETHVRQLAKVTLNSGLTALTI